MTKTGKDYLKLTLEDKTGVINAMVWDIGPQIGSFEKGDIIKIDAKASVYNDALQLTVSRLRRSQPGEYQVSDFFRTSREDSESRFYPPASASDNPYRSWSSAAVCLYRSNG